MTYTLAADGTSDRVLLPLLDWSLREQRMSPIVSQWADFSRIVRQPSLADKLRVAVELYPCDVLFVHRDAEGQAPELRRIEISNAVAGNDVRHIPVIPVRMTEAWLLADEQAIRAAAGNPNGAEDLNLPDVRRLEDVPDPKQILHNALVLATGLNARRRARFRVAERVYLIPNYIDDYSGLNTLAAFRALQENIRVAADAFRAG